MYKNAVISELLYYMAQRLKGGLGVDKIWAKGYISRLMGALDFMERSADLLEARRDVGKDEIMPLVDFVNANTDWLFLTGRIDIAEFCEYGQELVLTDNCDRDEYDEKIIARMREIIFEAKECLQGRIKGYKARVQELFHDYHNLPRAYLSRAYDPNVKTTFLGKDYSRWALPKPKALEYSQS